MPELRRDGIRAVRMLLDHGLLRGIPPRPALPVLRTALGLALLSALLILLPALLAGLRLVLALPTIARLALHRRLDRLAVGNGVGHAGMQGARRRLRPHQSFC